MDRQPFQIPPRRWSPRLSPLWVNIWRPLRRLLRIKVKGVLEVEVRGVEYLKGPVEAKCGVLITPNHAAHATRLWVMRGRMS